MPEPNPDFSRGTVIAAAPIEARFGHAAAWTNTEVVIVGGQRDFDSQPFDDGAAYDPKTGKWRQIAAFPLGPRTGATATWTGTEVIVWGGSAGGDGPIFLGEGAAYDPVADSWRPIAMPGVELSVDIWYEAVWTGSEMFIWGGQRGADPASVGAAYDPVTDHWREIPPAPLSARFNHSMVWTGSEVIFWGGNAADDSEAPLADGAAYDPSTNRWRTIASAPLEARSGHLAVWTNDAYASDAMLVWSGQGAGDHFLTTGAMYNPRADSWRLVDSPQIPPRIGATAIWTGSVALVWGGVTQPPPGCRAGALEDNPYAACDGVTFDPQADGRRGQWLEQPPGPLSERSGHSATWAGDVMVIWGGMGEDERPLADGAVYDPQIYWLSAPLAPTERAESDRFWEGLIPEQCPFPRRDWNSLDSMTAELEVVVRARAIGVRSRYDGRYDMNVAVVTFAIDELLKGKPMSHTEGTVDLVFYGGDQYRLGANMPDGEYLLLLMNLADVEGDGRPDDRSSYFLPSYQTVLRELDGRVSLFDVQDQGPVFLDELDGRVFDDVVDEIREIVSISPTAPIHPAGIGSGARVAPDIPETDPRIVMAC
jgi:N-acetylneuraminic acid mutarotase